MSLRFSGAELAQAEAASQTLLSPLAYAGIDAWRAATRHALERLLGADHSGSLLPLEGEPYAECDPEFLPGAVAYATYFHRLDTGLHVVRRARGLEVFSVHDIYDWAAYKRTEIYADWNRPYRLYDSVAMAYDVAPDRPAASLHFYHEHEEGPRFGERGLALLRLLRPSFVAGVETLLRAQAARVERIALLDRSGEALWLFDVAGRLVHETPAVAALLRPEPEAQRARLSRAAEELAGALAVSRRRGPHREPAVPAPRMAVRAARGVYHLTASLLGAALPNDRGVTPPSGPEAGILVTLASASGDPAPLPDAALRARYCLTARELAVARLLAERWSATEIAGALGITRHTARRHTEHVYERLGVHHRAEVAERLQGTSAQEAGDAAHV